MTNTINNVPRELLAELQEHIHCHHDAVLWGKVCALLSAPSPAGVDGLEVAGLSERIRPGVEAAPWVCDEVKKLETIIDGIRAENETLRKRAKTAEREAESALKTYKGLEKVARVVSDNSDQVCGELNVTRQQRDQLAGLLRMIASRGLSPVLTEHELEQIDASLAGLEAPGPALAVKLCVACRTLHPLDHFDKAAPDFPTRDGLNCNCRKSVAERGYRLMRLPNGKVEPRP